MSADSLDLGLDKLAPDGRVDGFEEPSYKGGRFNAAQVLLDPNDRVWIVA
jgi:hypothetical protein